MKRLLTAAVALPLALAAVFLLPSKVFFLLVLVILELATVEYTRLVHAMSPRAPATALLFAVPIGAVLLAPDLWPGKLLSTSGPLVPVAVVASVVAGCLVLVRRVPPGESLTALGGLTFGWAYLVLPAISLYQLHRADPWLLILLFAIVWLGDTAAFYVGKTWGRRKLAPVVSPNKTWEGAAASLVAGVIAAAAWSLWKLGSLEGSLVLLGGVTSVFAQAGDLVESLLKRGAGVKDSGRLLPGHGGVLDRIDALMFAAPVILLGLAWLGMESFSP